jgi:acetyl esterase/lipase
VLPQFDQVYAEPNGIPLRFDLFRPDSAGLAPLVVCIHGGGWISGEKEGMHEVAQLLARRGFAAACPQYRLAPLHPFPAAVEDVLAFVTFARANSEELGLDPQRFASLGNSAGGHLAAMAGLSKYADSRVQAVVDICGISDLTDPHSQHFPVSLGFLEQFMAQPFEGNEELYRLASPLYQVEPNAADFLLVHGEQDDIVPFGQSVALQEALKKVGADVRLHILPNEGHALSWDGWKYTERALLEFLEEKLLAQKAAPR